MPAPYDTAFIDETFLSHYDLVVRAVAFCAPDADLANDAVQQTYLEFFQNAQRGKWDLDRDVAPLLNKIARTIALRMWKERLGTRPKHLRLLEEYLHRKYDEAQSRHDEDTGLERMSLVRDCIRKLPEKSREMIELRYFQEKTIPEIAARMNVSEKTAQQILRRIREKIRRCVVSALRRDRPS